MRNLFYLPIVALLMLISSCNKNEGNNETPQDKSSAYITKVFDYMPAPGQHVNVLPKYEDGDTHDNMVQKVLEAIGDNNQRMITIGSYGGYVVVGFDHTIENVEGKLDFRVLGNATYSQVNPDEENLKGGSCEPGIIMVAIDTNGNGLPDDEWYEIQGSAHIDHTAEAWYNKAVESGNDTNFYFHDFELTYTKPESEIEPIAWSDNKGNNDYIAINGYHQQPYYPQWVSGNKLTFTGSRLPQNGIDESGNNSNFVLYNFAYGYADNGLNADDESAIDISWAVDSNGEKANLQGVDFIKIYNGVMQTNGWLGDCSTEVLGITDLHITGEDIDSFLK